MREEERRRSIDLCNMPSTHGTPGSAVLAIRLAAAAALHRMEQHQQQSLGDGQAAATPAYEED